MSDPYDEQERSPRFSRALLGRIIGVGLFIALGTFAVVQMMGDKDNKQANLENGAPNQTATDSDSEKSPSLMQRAASLFGGGNKDSKNPAEIKKPAENSDGKTPPASAPPAKPGATGGSFTDAGGAFNPMGGAPKKTSANKLLANGLKAEPYGSRNQVKTAKPVTPSNDFGAKSPPANRYAQRPGGTPMFGSNNGFNAQPKPGTAAVGSIADKINQAKNKTLDTAKQTANNIGNAANAKLNSLQKTTGNAANNLMSQIPNRNQTTSRATQAPAFNANLRSPASSQASNNNFGSRPKLNTNLAAPGGSAAKSSAQAPRSNPFASPSSSLGQMKAGTRGADSSGGIGIPTSPALSTKQPPSRQPPTQGFSSPLKSASRSPLQSPIQNRLNGNATAQTNSAPKSPFGSTAPINRTPNQFGQSAKSPTTFPNPNSTNQNRTTQSPIANPNKSFGSVRPMTTTQSPNQNRSNSRLGNTSPFSKASTGVPSRINAPHVSSRTENVPGDRKLEGVQTPALTVEKLSPREIQVNQTADFQIVVKNVGRVSAEDVSVYDQVPAGTDFLGSSPEPSGMSNDKKLTWNIGALRPGEEKRIKLQLRPTQPGEIGSVAHVTFSTQASMRTLVTKPVLQITHQTKPTVLIGDDVIFDVVVENKGDGAARNVVIQEDVPKQLEWPNGMADEGLEYEIGTLMPGQSKRIQLGLKAARIGRLRNIMFATAAGGLKTKHEIDMEVVAPNLSTTSDGPTLRYLQREATHKFGVANQGTAAATNVDLIARLPAGLRFVRADNRGRYDSNSHAVYWSLAQLGLKANAAVELTTMPVDVGNQDIKFEAVADLNQKAETIQKLAVEHLIDVFFDIDDVVDPIEIGSDTSYRIRIVNQGTKAATNVQLQIDFPNGLAPTAVDGNLQNQIQGQRILFTPISSMSPGDQIQFLVHGRGQAAGDHRVVVNMRADGRQTPVSKEETTRVYSDR